MIFGVFSLLVLSAILIFKSDFLGISFVLILLYVWSREFPNAQINIYGLVALKVCYILCEQDNKYEHFFFIASVISAVSYMEQIYHYQCLKEFYP